MNRKLLKNQIISAAAIIFSICITAVTIEAAGSGVAAGQTEKLIREVPSGTPQLNGIIEKDEWSDADKITMNENTCTASPWNGNIESSADVYFLWDEDGLYIAAEITDPTEAYAAEENPESVLSGDALQLGLNPGMLITGGHPGEFFTFALPSVAKKILRRRCILSDKTMPIIKESEAQPAEKCSMGKAIEQQGKKPPVDGSSNVSLLGIR